MQDIKEGVLNHSLRTHVKCEIQVGIWDSAMEDESRESRPVDGGEAGESG